jgi:hypothetical protein
LAWRRYQVVLAMIKTSPKIKMLLLFIKRFMLNLAY